MNEQIKKAIEELKYSHSHNGLLISMKTCLVATQADRGDVKCLD